jgi:hypothetical protein
MSTVEPLSPWAEGFDDGTAEGLRIALLFRAVPEPAPLSDVARQRLGLRLRTRAGRSSGLILLRLVVVGAVIGMAGAAAAQWATTHILSGQRELVRPRTPVVVLDPPLVPQPSLPRVAALPEEIALPVEVTAEPEVVNAPAPPGAGMQSSRLGQEAASLEVALSALRAGGKERASKALAAIEQHLRTFPGGPLELEARVARVDALLVLGRRQEAKRELAALPIENVGRNRELRLIRAELRADDDCRTALGDFQVLLDQPLAPAWQERALFGRGACLLRLGERAAAERDFERYLQQFPSGRFAEQIRAQQQQ